MPNDSTVLKPSMMTRTLPGVGGTFKSEHSDFYVEEIPLRQLGKKGSHVYFFIEKKGLTTAEALREISRGLGQRNRDIGYAGLKDAHAVTRQWISIERVPPDRVRRLKLRHIKILDWGRSETPLRIGQLKGNRFRVRLRELSGPLAQAEKRARDILEVLCDRGLPNAFGPQRFGNRDNSHVLGKAALLNQREVFLDLLMGDPRPEDNANEFRVRSLYSRAQFNKALKTCPAHLSDTRRVLSALVRHCGDKQKAFGSVAQTRIRFLVSAYQSYLFNQVLNARMPHIDQLLPGDIAFTHGSEACFCVKDQALEQHRCNQFEISPSGPIYSPAMDKPTARAGKIENVILHEAQVSNLTRSAEAKRLLGSGGRRPLRILPENAEISQGRNKYGEYLEVKFDLTSGSYATVLLREIMK
ncbi:MAG: tRNA pseudouridine(13) synthase TruD [Planctomycetes bacterium]|nr:tRNA pseudouridine(13) synthase TruD [Planctomycetota bacterium]